MKSYEVRSQEILLRLWAVCFSLCACASLPNARKTCPNSPQYTKGGVAHVVFNPPISCESRSPLFLVQRIKLLPITTLNLYPSGHVCFWVVQFIGFPLIHDPCCKPSSCFGHMLHSLHDPFKPMLLLWVPGCPSLLRAFNELKVRLHSLWLLSSVASTALENKLILTGAISSENDSGGLKFSSLHKSVLSHSILMDAGPISHCITWWSCGSAGF